MAKKLPKKFWENLKKVEAEDFQRAYEIALTRNPDLADLMNAEYISAEEMKPRN